MKNFKIYTTLLLLSCITLGSCTEEFLDEPKNTNGVTADVVFGNSDIVQSFITGILRNFRSQYSSVDTAGLQSIYFARTIKGNDLIQAPSWYLFDYAHENREPTYRRTVFNWDFSYDQINQANTLITGVTNSSLDEAAKKEFIAVGKALRGFFLFQLALDFAPNLNNDPTVARLPIYLEPATGASLGNPASSLGEVYNQIIADLKEAIQDLPDDRAGKSYINKAVAQGILARVLLVTQDDWTLASSLAKSVYGGNAAAAVPSTSYGTGFLDMNDPEWVWAMYQDEIESTYYWGAPANLTDHLSDVAFYKATFVNTNFVSTFSGTDERNLFFDIYGSSTPYREFITTKFSFTLEEDFPIMRKSEMVLIDAEAQYRMSNETEAHNLLFALQKDRDPSATKSANTGQNLLNEILLERRKELYGENGVEFFDAKRLRLPIDRDPVHRVEIDVPADSELFYLKIPQKEIDANPNFDESINN